jgi:hypothetical protein
MKTDKPFMKAFCAGIIYYLILMTILLAFGLRVSAEKAGYWFGTMLIPSLIIGLWARLSRKMWRWADVFLWVGVISIVVILMQGFGHH